ncbi:MAG: RDD family protein [Campylobacteraceae bacterium]|jgi:uncharacterized RDD family membrane protein YckC|nr:RDD family protein [Campylobacteraceae bacterium]
MTEEELIKKFESENITLASFTKRFIAYAIDDFIIAVLMCMSFAGIISTASSSEENLQMVLEYLTPYFIIAKIVYQSVFVYLYGATIGKIAVKIRVIYINSGEKPNFYISFIRSVVRIVSEAILFIGFLWAFKDSKRQTWQDVAAQTLVVDA